MQRVVLACLALCVAVAMSNPINSVSIGTQITNVRNDQVCVMCEVCVKEVPAFFCGVVAWTITELLRWMLPFHSKPSLSST